MTTHEDNDGQYHIFTKDKDGEYRLLKSVPAAEEDDRFEVTGLTDFNGDAGTIVDVPVDGGLVLSLIDLPPGNPWEYTMRAPQEHSGVGDWVLQSILPPELPIEQVFRDSGQPPAQGEGGAQ